MLAKRHRASKLRVHDTLGNIKHLAGLISENKNVVFLSGAGLSCASFRGRKDAIWRNSLFDKEKFLENPVKWYEDFFFKHFLVIHHSKPNTGHHAIAEITGNFPNCKVITQNIDLLHSHEQSQIPSSNLIEIHGNVSSFRCFTKTCIYSNKKTIHKSEPVTKIQDIPNCPECGTICCPNTLLFDEEYNDHEFYQFEQAIKWLEEADAIVFVGTSFSVGITTFAFEAAQERIVNDLFIELFNFNIDDTKPRAKAVDVTYNFIDGLCENTLQNLKEELWKQTVNPFHSH